MPKSVRLWIAPFGIKCFFTLPAPWGSDVTLAGMLKTTQCHQPLPVGALGSYMVIAKLLVPAGAPLQFNAGEMLLPVQPKPLNTCALEIFAPSLMSGLVSVRSAAEAAPAPSTVRPKAAIRIENFFMAFLPRARF